MVGFKPLSLLLISLLAGLSTAAALGQEPGDADKPISARPDRPYSLALQDVDAEEAGETEEFVEYEIYGEETTETVFEEEGEPEPLLWKGFLYGDRHFRHKPRPIGSPLYFEDPFINTDIRAFYLWHKFSKKTAIGGGDMSIWGMQARLALTDRLQFIVTADGYTKMNSGLLTGDEGWNDLALGLKYALWVDHEDDFILSAGLRWRLSNGTAGILQGNVDELSPFVTAYKGWGKWGFMADVAGRIPMDFNEGNCIVSWNTHVSYELFENFYPLMEVHGLHYLSNGDRHELDVGGLDYANIGSDDVAGHSAFWATAGFHWNITEHLAWSAGWGFPLQSRRNNDIFDQRATMQFQVTF